MSYTDKMFSLSDKVIVITGGGGVIAHAMAEAYLQAGASVSLWDIKLEFAQAAKDRLSKSVGFSDKIHIAEADAFSESSVQESLNSCEKALGAPNVLVNAAGGNKGKSSFVDVDIPLFQDIVNLNLIAGLMVPTKILSSYWLSQNLEGTIINMASMASYIPLSGVWAYDASKAAVKNLTMACAKEFAPNIRVNAIAPGFFIGKQNRDLLIDKETGDLTQRGQDVINHTPFGRFGDVSELSGVALFLASDSASGFITGITVPVDGGYLVHNI